MKIGLKTGSYVAIIKHLMHLSIVGPTIPPGAEGGEWWGFDQTSDQISHHLGRLGCQIPS